MSLVWEAPLRSPSRRRRGAPWIEIGAATGLLMSAVPDQCAASDAVLHAPKVDLG